MLNANYCNLDMENLTNIPCYHVFRLIFERSLMMTSMTAISLCEIQWQAFKNNTRDVYVTECEFKISLMCFIVPDQLNT